MTRPASALTHLDSIDPFTGEIIASVALTPIDAIPRLIFQAREAQRGWGALTHGQRADVLRSAAARLKEEAVALGTLASREMGKPLAEAIGEANYCSEGLLADLDEIVAALADIEREDKQVASIVVDPYWETADVDIENNYYPRRLIPSRVEAFKSEGAGGLTGRDLMQDIKTELKTEEETAADAAEDTGDTQ